jgi:5-methylcytosine-specific restriction endonuclease McrA
MIEILTSNTRELSKQYLHRTYPQYSKEVYTNYYVLERRDMDLLLSPSYWKNNYVKFDKGFKKKIAKKDLTNFNFIKQKKNRIKLLNELGLPYNYIIKFMKWYYPRIGKSTLAYHLNEKTRKKQLKATRKRQQTPMYKFKRKIQRKFDIVGMSDDKLFKHLGTCCYLCSKKINPLKTSTWEIEHIIPTISGGSGHVNNLGMSCKPCNRVKSEYSIPEYIEYIEQQYHHVKKNKSKLISTYNKALKYSMQ